MKKTFPLLVLLLLCLFSTASAANIAGQQSISYVSDSAGYVTSLTDDNSSTVWTRPSSGGVDLTLNLYSGTVGEIWIRNGYADTQNLYTHYDRAGLVKVTVHYYANQYTTSYDTYRYRLTDTYRPYSSSQDWRDGYQRLLLPKKYTGVTKIELTIEETITGFGRTGAAISDIIVASGSHATATPRAYATATPRPYVVYVTPTPGPAWEDDGGVTVITPIPSGGDDGDYVEYITPRPAATEPLVELLTPTPEPIVYPSAGGVIATLSQRAATRSGPGTRFDEPGSFFQAGKEVKVISKVYDEYNNVWWYQIEFKYSGSWYRVYTTESRVDVNASRVPQEPAIYDPLDTQKALKKVKVRFGPGMEYAEFSPTVVHEGVRCDIYAIENGWVQIEYTDYGSPEDPQPQRRGWVPLDVIYPN